MLCVGGCVPAMCAADARVYTVNGVERRGVRCCDRGCSARGPTRITEQTLTPHPGYRFTGFLQEPPRVASSSQQIFGSSSLPRASQHGAALQPKLWPTRPDDRRRRKKNKKTHTHTETVDVNVNVSLRKLLRQVRDSLPLPSQLFLNVSPSSFPSRNPSWFSVKNACPFSLARFIFLISWPRTSIDRPTHLRLDHYYRWIVTARRINSFFFILSIKILRDYGCSNGVCWQCWKLRESFLFYFLVSLRTLDFISFVTVLTLLGNTDLKWTASICRKQWSTPRRVVSVFVDLFRSKLF